MDIDELKDAFISAYDEWAVADELFGPLFDEMVEARDRLNIAQEKYKEERSA